MQAARSKKKEAPKAPIVKATFIGQEGPWGYRVLVQGKIVRGSDSRPHQRSMIYIASKSDGLMSHTLNVNDKVMCQIIGESAEILQVYIPPTPKELLSNASAPGTWFPSKPEENGKKPSAYREGGIDTTLLATGITHTSKRMVV